MKIDNRKALDNAEIKIQIPVMDYCRRCGVPVPTVKRKPKLRCNHCMKYVDAELNGGEEHPFDFYFQYYQECKNKTKSNVKDAENE